MSLVNYYAILGVAQDATDDEIRRAIRVTRNMWTGRSNHPDPDVRSESEKNVRHCTEAEKILLEQASRRSYDARLRTQPTEQPPQSTRDGKRDWIHESIDYRNRGMWSQAKYAIGIAIQEDPNDAEAWRLQGSYCNALGQLEEAEKSFNQAMMIDPTEPLYALSLTDFYIDHRRQSEAERCLDFAAGKEHGNLFVTWWMAEASRRLGRLDDAIRYATAGLKLDPEHKDCLFELALAKTIKLKQDVDSITNVPNIEWFTSLKDQLNDIDNLGCDSSSLFSVRNQFDELFTSDLLNLVRSEWRNGFITSYEQITEADRALAGLKILGFGRRNNNVSEMRAAIDSSQFVKLHRPKYDILAEAWAWTRWIGFPLGIILALFVFPPFVLIAPITLFIVVYAIQYQRAHMPTWQWHARN